MKNKIMKSVVISVLFSLTGIFCLSCSSDDEIKKEYNQNFKESYSVWLKFKTASKNSYYYVAESSSWVGFRTKTKILVKEGVVAKREFDYTYFENGKLVEKDARSWTEVGDELGKHKEGAALLTLDEIYEKAEKEWIVKKSNVRNYFEAKNNGMLSLCGYVDNRCADDCFVGISISEIVPISEP